MNLRKYTSLQREWWFWGVGILAWLFRGGLVGAQSDSSQPTWKVEIQQSQISLQDRLQMKILVTTNRPEPPRIRFPTSRYFRYLTSRRSRTQEMAYLSGGQTAVRYVWSYQVIWKPKKKGVYVLEPAQLKVGQQWFRSQAISVTVGSQKSPDPATDQTHEELAWREDIQPSGSTFLHAVLSQQRVVWGQQVTLSYYLLTRYGETITRAQPPAFVDFDYETLRGIQLIQLQKTITVRGIRYRYALAARYALFPKRTGRLRIPGMSMWIQRDHDQQHMIRSPQPFLDVQELPAPSAAIAGILVGRYAWHSAQAHPQAHPLVWRQGVPTPWQLCIRGTGNVRQVRWKPPRWPNGVQVLYHRWHTTISPHTPGHVLIRGITCQTWYLRPQQAGSWVIPATQITQYDPWSQQMQMVTSSPQPIKILPSYLPPSRTNTPPSPLNNPAVSPSPPQVSGQPSSTSSVLLLLGRVGVVVIALLLLWLVLSRFLRRQSDSHTTEDPEIMAVSLQAETAGLQQRLLPHLQATHLGAEALRDIEQSLLHWIGSYVVSKSLQYSNPPSKEVPRKLPQWPQSSVFSSVQEHKQGTDMSTTFTWIGGMRWEDTKRLLQEYQLPTALIEDLGIILQWIQRQRFSPQQESPQASFLRERLRLLLQNISTAV